MRWVSLTLSVLLLATVALVFSHCLDDDEGPVSRSAEAVGEDAPKQHTPATLDGTPELQTRSPVPADGCRVSVLTKDGRPASGARLAWLNDTARVARAPSQLSRAGTVDAVGQAVVRTDRPRWLVALGSQGHSSDAVKIVPESRQVTLQLPNTSAVRVACTLLDGRPLADVRIRASRTPLPQSTRTSAGPGPIPQTAVWTAVSDPTGVALLREVYDGDYHLSVEHDQASFSTASAKKLAPAGNLLLVREDTSINIEFCETFVAIARFSDDKLVMVRRRFNYPGTRAYELAVRARGIQRLIRALAKESESGNLIAAVFATEETITRKPTVIVEALLLNRGWQTFEMDLIPLSTYKTPREISLAHIPLLPKPSAASVAFRLPTDTETKLWPPIAMSPHDMPIRLRRKDGFVRSMPIGRPVLVPCGEYDVSVRDPILRRVLAEDQSALAGLSVTANGDVVRQLVYRSQRTRFRTVEIEVASPFGFAPKVMRVAAPFPNCSVSLPVRDGKISARLPQGSYSLTMIPLRSSWSVGDADFVVPHVGQGPVRRRVEIVLAK